MGSGRITIVGLAAAVMLAAAGASAQEASRCVRSAGGGQNCFVGAEAQAELDLLIAQSDAAVAAENWPEAETLLNRLLERDWNETRAISTLRSLARVREGQGRYSEAVAAYRSVFKQSEQAWGGDRFILVPCLYDLTRAEFRDGQLRNAERTGRRTLDMAIERLEAYRGGHHSDVIDGPAPSTLAVLDLLAQVLAARGRPQDMAPLYRRVLPVYVEVMGENDPLTRAVAARLAILEAA